MTGPGGTGANGAKKNAAAARAAKAARPVVPGELLLGTEPVPLNPGRPTTTLRVLNTGDRPVQVGSHLHFPAANDALDFDRGAAWGRRLDVPAGTAVRFEPGVAREVTLVPLAGARVVPGLKAGRGGVLDAVADAAPEPVPDFVPDSVVDTVPDFVPDSVPEPVLDTVSDAPGPSPNGHGPAADPAAEVGA